MNYSSSLKNQILAQDVLIEQRHERLTLSLGLSALQPQTASRRAWRGISALWLFDLARNRRMNGKRAAELARSIIQLARLADSLEAARRVPLAKIMSAPSRPSSAYSASPVRLAPTCNSDLDSAGCRQSATNRFRPRRAAITRITQSARMTARISTESHRIQVHSLTRLSCTFPARAVIGVKFALRSHSAVWRSDS